MSKKNCVASADAIILFLNIIHCPVPISGPEIDWAQLSRVLPEDGDRIQSPKRCVLNKNRTTDNVKNRNDYVNILSSQTFRLLLLMGIIVHVELKSSNSY
jgi:hypothetical protein